MIETNAVRAVLAALCLVLASACLAQTSDVPAAAALCVACHGGNGLGVADDVPALGGQHEHYLVDRLKRFSRPHSGSETMSSIVAAVGEAQFREAANYFARLPYLRKKQVVDPEKAERGKVVYQRVCQLCHIEEGRASTYVEYPLLASQSLPYLQKTMADILAGRRMVDEVKMSMLSLLSATPERIDDALHFFASQEVDPASMAVPAAGGQKQRRRRFQANP